jgi:DNA primase
MKNSDINILIILATLINNPNIAEDYIDKVESIIGEENKLLNIVDNICNWIHEKQENNENFLDSEGLKHHLIGAGLKDVLDNIISPRVYAHASFAKPNTPDDKTRQGLDEIISRIGNKQLEDDLKIAKRELILNFSPESEARVMEMQRLLNENMELLSENVRE